MGNVDGDRPPPRLPRSQHGQGIGLGGIVAGSGGGFEGELMIAVPAAAGKPEAEVRGPGGVPGEGEGAGARGNNGRGGAVGGV